MRSILGLVLTVILVSAAAAAEPKLIWEAKGLAQPESVVYDPTTDVLYVSNINGAVMNKKIYRFLGFTLHYNMVVSGELERRSEVTAHSGIGQRSGDR